MLRTRILRAAVMLAVVGMMTVARPADAEDRDFYCLRACAVETGASGYFGEDAFAYFTGCLLGCLSRNLQ